MNYRLGYLIDLALVITKKELKVRYKNSFLGYIWSVANPLLFTIIYYFIFKLIMRVPIPNYTLFLITGLFPWQWFSGCVTNSSHFFLANTQLIKKTVFPRSFIPLSNVLMECFHFLCTVPVIIVFLLFYGMSPSWQWLWGLPLIGVAQMAIIFGITLMLSTLNLFFRDLERFIALTMMVLFYCTPIIYSAEMIPDNYHWLVDYNPCAAMVLSWRELLLNGRLDYPKIGTLYLYACMFLMMGRSIFNQLKYKLAEIL